MIRTGMILAGMLAATALAGCAHVKPVAHPLYPGPARPTEEVARLTGPVARVDGIDVSSLGSLFTLLPGCHVVELPPRIGEGSVGGAWSADIRQRFYVFNMKAGSSYEIEVHLQPGNDSLGSGTVGGAKIRAVERDARGKVVATIAPARKDAEVKACRAPVAEGGDSKPKPDVPLPSPEPATVGQEPQQDQP